MVRVASWFESPEGTTWSLQITKYKDRSCRPFRTSAMVANKSMGFRPWLVHAAASRLVAMLQNSISQAIQSYRSNCSGFDTSFKSWERPVGLNSIALCEFRIIHEEHQNKLSRLRLQCDGLTCNKSSYNRIGPRCRSLFVKPPNASKVGFRQMEYAYYTAHFRMVHCYSLMYQTGGLCIKQLDWT